MKRGRVIDYWKKYCFIELFTDTDNCADCIMSFPQCSIWITALNCHATHAVINNINNTRGLENNCWSRFKR